MQRSDSFAPALPGVMIGDVDGGAGELDELTHSWRRSQMCGIDRACPPSLPYEPSLSGSEKLRRAASPVLAHLEEFLAEPTALLLLDGRGWVRARWCNDSALTARLDAVQASTGHCWLEEFAGTSAASLAYETRRASWVVGDEHYRLDLADIAGAAAPIVDRPTRRFAGVVVAHSLVPDASRHMLAVAVQAASAVEERLVGDASSHEHTLLARFLSAKARPGRAVVVLGSRFELSTPAAARMLDVTDRTLLWERATALVRHDPAATGLLELSDGTTVSASVERVDDGGSPIGLVAELEVVRPGVLPRGDAPLPAPAPDLGKGFVGRSGCSGHLRAEVSELARESMPVVIVGEAGVGKLTLAYALAADREPVPIDATRCVADGEAALRAQVTAALEVAGRAIIVRRVHCLSDETVDWLADVAASVEPDGSRLIVTCTAAAHGAWTDRGRSANGFGLRLEIPPLRERLDDIFDLVPHFIERRGGTGRMVPSALQALTRYDWPGNARELDALVRALLATKRTADITLADLPATYHVTGRRLRRIEQIERSAILQALAEGEGNKSRAAELLEIGRATLYRKITAYGIDLELTTA